MNNKTKILSGVIVLILIVFLSILSYLNYENLETLVGFIGVLLGIIISEIFHNQAAKDNRVHQLSMAALDRRLQAHQEAYSLWWRMRSDKQDQVKISNTTSECQEWWVKNCLYLTPEARNAFNSAYVAAQSFPQSLATRDTNLMTHETKTIENAGRIIVEGVHLPPIAKVDYK